MTEVVPTPQVEDIWYKGQRVIRSILVALPTLLVTLNLSLPLVADAFRAEGIPPSVYLVVNATIVGAMVIIGVLTKIIAIPAVNKWLTKFGAGSVPKSAVSN